MTITYLLDMARNYATARNVSVSAAHDLAQGILDLLGEAQPCGWEAPTVWTLETHPPQPAVRVPSSWSDGLSVSPDDAEAMARMLLHAAAEARGAVDR